MYNKINLNSKKYNIDNNSIFKQVDTNIITDYQRKMYLIDLMQNQPNTTFYKTNTNYHNKNKIYVNGTIDPDENNNYFQAKRNKNNNLGDYNTNTNKINKNKKVLNRYNSYGRINTNLNNNTISNHINRQFSKNKKVNNIDHRQNKIQTNNNSRGYNNTNIQRQKSPISNKKKNIIPLGNNKYKTIGDNNNYSNYGKKIYYDNSINKTYIQNKAHNTIDLNNFYSNKDNNMNKKYNLKMSPNYLNYNYNYNTIDKQNSNKNNYNLKNTETNNTKRNRSKSRPKTPDFNKRGKSSSRFNINNQRAKTPDRQRNKMKLNLNKDYLYTAANKSSKKPKHYNYMNRDYNNTIDNKGKYNFKNQMKKLDTNDYFKLHKKTINNYDYKDTINNNNTITSNNKSRKYSCSKIYNSNNQQNKKNKKLSKNASQGSILGHNNYNINLNSNGINHIHNNININENYNNHNSYLNNTNLITPIKYINQKSNFKGEEVQMTQIRAPNNYNIYEETFQSFGRNIPTSIHNDYYKKNYNQNKIITERKSNYNNKIENREEKKDKIYRHNYEEYKISSLQNYNNSIKNINKDRQLLNYELTREKNGNYNNKTYIPATITNIGNKTYSYFNMKKDIKINQKENINNNDIQEYNEINDIDFNDLDQFSPPYTKDQLDLTNNTDNSKINKNNNLYINIGSIQEQNNNYNNKYNIDFNKKLYYGNNLFLNENNDKNNRRVIDDFINQLKPKF